MAWDFKTDADFQTELDWIDEFVRDEVEPLDFVIFRTQRTGKLCPSYKLRCDSGGCGLVTWGPSWAARAMVS